MRVCIMMDSWLPELPSGGYVATWELAKRLVERHGCKVDLLVGTQLDEQGNKPAKVEIHLDGKLKIKRIGLRAPAESMLGKLAYCVAAIPHAVNKQYDLIHAQAFAPGFPGRLASWLAGVPVVYTVHGIGVGVTDQLSKSWLSSRLLEYFETFLLFKIRYDHQISVSRDVLDHPNANKRVTIIPNGVNIAEYDAVQCAKAVGTQIVFVGRFHPQKGLQYLIEATKMVCQRYSDVTVLMVGSGQEEQALRQQVVDAGLEQHFEFAGPLYGPAKVQAFKSSHLFVLPSVYEGQPLTLLEAWAAKLPVVVTGVGANPDFVRDGVNGYLVEPGRPDLLAEMIVRAIENPSLPDLGLEGYRLVKQELNWDRNAEETYRVYREVLKRR